jgi:ACS family tartrate transporter-like MFS transporter
VQGWRWLFFVEGLPAVLLGIVAFFFLTDRPREARWLTREQRQWLEQELQGENNACTKAITIWQALSYRPILLLASIPFFSYFAMYCFQFWFQIILKRHSGFSDLRVGLIGALPFLAYFVAMQLNGWHSDKTGERRWHSALLLFMASAALLALLLQNHSVPVLIVSFTVVGIGAAYLPTFWAIPTEILSKSSAATGVGLINSVGSISGFAGPYSFGYLYARTGSFSAGLTLMMMAALAAGLLILCTPERCHTRMMEPKVLHDLSFVGPLPSVNEDELV